MTGSKPFSSARLLPKLAPKTLELGVTRLLKNTVRNASTKVNPRYNGSSSPGQTSRAEGKEKYRSTSLCLNSFSSSSLCRLVFDMINEAIRVRK